MMETFSVAVGIAILCAAFAIGGAVARDNVATDCRKLQASIIDGKVFDCKERSK